jgi:uncharacterized protein (TIGR03000 family)
VKKFYSLALFGVAAAAVTLATPGISSAGGHHGRGHYHSHYHRSYGYWGHYHHRGLGYYYRTSNYYCAPAPICTNVARINMCVPAAARVWIDGQETTQTGSERSFESPALSPGQDYTYCITARWCGPDGKEVTVKRDVDVRANATVRVNMTAAAS